VFNPRQTIVRKVSADKPEPAIIAEAAKILRAGGLVAFPTETVYGLGANALDATAVASIFAAKGRPANNPIIVHVADTNIARSLVTSWPDRAASLAERFWPGPLTLVLPKSPEVPDIVTAGAATVALRIPAHPVALALLKAAAIPTAAPSANRSSRISPTTANHVRRGLEGHIDFILDAGPTPGGLESTVVDLTTDPPRLLRPGLITKRQLESIIGQLQLVAPLPPDASLPSPGMLNRHYAPRARMLFAADSVENQIDQLHRSGHRVGWLRMAAQVDKETPPADARVGLIEMPLDAAAYAARLYAALHELDDAGVDYIVVDRPPEGDAWLAIHDRLRRAAHPQQSATL
jgi:L-threonylcarbamoyladenylate synthase